MAARTLIRTGGFCASTLLLLTAACPLLAADTPEVRRLLVLENWRKEKWSPERMLEIVQERPEVALSLGNVTSGPTGIGPRRWPELKPTIDRLQRLATEQEIDIAGRLLVPYRIYVHRPFKLDWKECKPGCGWDGTVRDDPFDTDWIAQVPLAHHQEMVRKNLACDPYAESGYESCWASYVDAERIRALRKPGSVPALYGTHMAANGVLVDVRKPALRQWMYRRMIRKLREVGFDPGDPPIVVEIVTKPGWMVHYADTQVDTRDPCWEAGSHMWTGPAKPCRGLRSPGGALHYVGKFIYGPGEYETVYNIQIRETKAALEAAGFHGALISTVERPAYGLRRGSNGRWSTLTSETRQLPYLLGERRSPGFKVPGLSSN